MVRVAPINLQFNPKTLWFDPEELDIHKGDAVVVTTVRGLEFGHAADDIQEVTQEAINKIRTELKPVLRIATLEDQEQASKMSRKNKEALPVFKEMAAEFSSDMRPVSVEYLLEGDKAVFYFEAEERVDFRELVRRLASHFRIRVDMRQIGVRDEARLIGGIGHCGQELCCKRLGGEFCPVSIRMAKEQGLSLNPQKISGVCGRLMCCLRYEYDAYKDFRERAPKLGAKITTPEGLAKVVELQIPREIIVIKLDGGKPIKIPLGEMTVTGDGVRPNTIDSETLSRHSQAAEPLAALGTTPNLSDGPLVCDRKTGPKKVLGGQDVIENDSKKEKDKRKPRRRTRVANKTQSDTQTQERTELKTGVRQNQEVKQDLPKSVGKQPEKPEKDQSSSRRSRSKKAAPKKASPNKVQQKQGPRPGQHSSGLREGISGSSEPSTKPSVASSKPNTASTPSPLDGTGHRKPRRRSHKTGQPDEG